MEMLPWSIPSGVVKGFIMGKHSMIVSDAASPLLNTRGS
jgi:hypothetical protein